MSRDKRVLSCFFNGSSKKGCDVVYRVLYRKYRPRFFADVIGQPQVTDTLKNELIAGRIAHAYLFTGSRGTGKTTCSKILAKAVNCLDPQNGDPCGKCAACLGIDNGSIMDVVEIDAASNNGVDDIRSLRDETVFAPADVKYRVYIIDEVHMLSIGAFNALLKTLEEPPPHVIFILATTELHKLPATILSRCQRFDFHRIAPADIAQRLQLVCQSEGVNIEENAALLLAGIADGAMRDALSLLDQCMGRSDNITEEVVRKTAGLADKSHLIGLTDKFISKDAGAAIEMIDELYAGSKDMARLCDELISHYRSMMLMKTMKKPRDVLVMSDEDYKKTESQSEALPLAEVISGIETLRSAYENMQRGANRRVEMELTAVKMCDTPASSNAVMDPNFEKRLVALENALKNPVRAASAAATPVQKASSSSPAAPIRMKRPSAEEMEKLRSSAQPMTQWPEVIEEIKKSSKTIAAGFEGSTAYISGRYVLVDSPNDICFELLKVSSQRESMRVAIKKVTGQEYKLGRYSYPDEVREDDALSELMTDFKSAGIPVDNNNNNNS